MVELNILIAGPCGVGKSTTAKLLAGQTSKRYLDFDELGLADMETRKGSISPFSTSGLNLKLSLPSIIDTISGGFVLDMGGDTVFRRRADNDERLTQVLWLKVTYSTTIVVLTAEKDILFERFMGSKNRKAVEFNKPWQDWETIAIQYWRQYADLFIDTSFQNKDKVCSQIRGVLAS